METNEFRALAVEAAYLQVQKLGVKSLSMRKLAKQMGWSTQKLYSNFENKDDLLLAIAARLRERIRELDFSVKRSKDPVRYLIDLTMSTLHFFVREPAALEILMEQRYRLDAVLKDTSDPYHEALRALNSDANALSSIRLLLVGAAYSLQGASPIQRKAIFKGFEFALCRILVV